MMKNVATRPHRIRRYAATPWRAPKDLLVLLFAVLSTHEKARCLALLESNPPEQPQDISSVVCDGTHGLNRPNCEVELDVPEVCSGPSSSCPVVFFLHGSGGTNDWFGRTSGIHAEGVVGVYPQGEGGWNTGPKSTNVCDWTDFDCVDDPDEGAFVARIISELRSRGANGNVYVTGNSNGAALAHRLASNAGDALPIKGVVVKVTQLLSSPDRSGPGVLNHNQPSPGGPPVSVLSVMGTSDGLIPYDGGTSSVFGGDAGFQLMPALESMDVWAGHDGCDLARTEVSTHTSDMGDGQAIKYKYRGCQSGTIVEHYAVLGAGHNAGGVAIDGVAVDYELTYDFIRKCEAGGDGDGSGGGPGPSPNPPTAPTGPTAPAPTAPAPTAPAPSPASSSCVDDPTWAGKFNPDHTCSYIAEDPAVRCVWEDADGVLASAACQATCDPSCGASQMEAPLPPPVQAPVPLPTSPSAGSGGCIDEPNWAGKFNPNHTCAYVAQEPAARCGWEDADGVLASAACQAACDPSCSTAATSAPMAAPPVSPPAPCASCTNVATPWMVESGEACAGSSKLETKCNLNEWWTSNKFCQHSCYLAGLGYEDDVCCPTCIDCTDEETPWMIGEGLACSTTNWLLSSKCSLDTYWANNKYCQLSCYNKGLGYEEICCQTCKHSGQTCESSQDCCHGMCHGDGKCA